MDLFGPIRTLRRDFWHGDCLELMRDIRSGSVDMVLCDLPYGTTQNKWDAVIPFEPLWREYWRVLKPNGAVVLTAQPPFDKILGASQIEHLKYEWIWRKEAGTGHLNAKKQPMKDCENVMVFYREQCSYNPQMRTGFRPYSQKSGRASANYGSQVQAVSESNGERYPLSLIEFSRDRNSFHPTQKPVALFEYMIKTYTHPGETVLDNCAGSGTTAIAAMNTGRGFICIEKDADYFQRATERVARHA